MNCPRLTICGLLPYLLSYSFGISSNAEDRVKIQIPGTSRPITVVGDIIDSTGKSLTIRRLDGKSQSIPADQIVGIKTHYQSHHIAALQFYNSGQIENAFEEFRVAYDNEPRDWAKREIAAWITRCSLVQGDWITAIQFFREILKSDTRTRHWGSAPLVWSPVSLSDSDRQFARPLLVSTYPEERLIAASILLFDPTSGTTALREMNDLASDTNPRISRLARAQLWRTAFPENRITKNILQGWRGDIERLSESLRPGPQYLLAKGYLHLGEQRVAAAEFLKLTIVYRNHDLLSARATLDAAEAIERTGLTQEADLLYRELSVRFPSTAEAGIAREKRQKLSNGS